MRNFGRQLNWCDNLRHKAAGVRKINAFVSPIGIAALV